MTSRACKLSGQSGRLLPDWTHVRIVPGSPTNGAVAERQCAGLLNRSRGNTRAGSSPARSATV